MFDREYTNKLDDKVKLILDEVSNDGINVDMTEFDKLLAEDQAELDRLQSELDALVGYHLNVNKVSDVSKYLFDELGLTPVILTPKGAPSISAEALDYFDLPQVDLITKIKSMKTQITAYSKLPTYIKSDGKIHPTFNVVGDTNTSRIFTKDPAISSIGPKARHHLVPAKGNKFVYADLSSAEMALALYQANATELLNKYWAGIDLHTEFAKLLLDINEVTKEERNISKIIEFSILYGSEGYSAAKKLHCSESDAKLLLDKFFDRVPEIRNLVTAKHNEVIATKGTTTILGRYRQLNYTNFYPTAKVLRQSVNTSIQSGVADLMKESILKLSKYSGVKLRFTIFDSFLLEVPESMSDDEITAILDDITEYSNIGINFHFKYDYKFGKSFYEASK